MSKMKQKNKDKEMLIDDALYEIALSVVRNDQEKESRLIEDSYLGRMMQEMIASAFGSVFSQDEIDFDSYSEDFQKEYERMIRENMYEILGVALDDMTADQIMNLGKEAKKERKEVILDSANKRAVSQLNQEGIYLTGHPGSVQYNSETNTFSLDGVDYDNLEDVEKELNLDMENKTVVSQLNHDFCTRSLQAFLKSGFCDYQVFYDPKTNTFSLDGVDYDNLEDTETALRKMRIHDLEKKYEYSKSVRSEFEKLEILGGYTPGCYGLVSPCLHTYNLNLKNTSSKKVFGFYLDLEYFSNGEMESYPRNYVRCLIEPFSENECDLHLTSNSVFFENFELIEIENDDENLLSISKRELHELNSLLLIEGQKALPDLPSKFGDVASIMKDSQIRFLRNQIDIFQNSKNIDNLSVSLNYENKDSLDEISAYTISFTNPYQDYVSKVVFNIRLFSYERDLEWFEERFYVDVEGGLDPGKSHSFSVTNGLDRYGGTFEGKEDAVLVVDVVQVLNHLEEPLYQKISEYGFLEMLADLQRSKAVSIEEYDKLIKSISYPEERIKKQIELEIGTLSLLKQRYEEKIGGLVFENFKIKHPDSLFGKDPKKIKLTTLGLGTYVLVDGREIVYLHEYRETVEDIKGKGGWSESGDYEKYGTVLEKIYQIEEYIDSAIYTDGLLGLDFDFINEKTGDHRSIGGVDLFLKYISDKDNSIIRDGKFSVIFSPNTQKEAFFSAFREDGFSIHDVTCFFNRTCFSSKEYFSLFSSTHFLDSEKNVPWWKEPGFVEYQILDVFDSNNVSWFEDGDIFEPVHKQRLDALLKVLMAAK